MVTPSLVLGTRTRAGQPVAVDSPRQNKTTTISETTSRTIKGTAAVSVYAPIAVALFLLGEAACDCRYISQPREKRRRMDDAESAKMRLNIECKAKFSDRGLRSVVADRERRCRRYYKRSRKLSLPIDGVPGAFKGCVDRWSRTQHFGSK